MPLENNIDIAAAKKGFNEEESRSYKALISLLAQITADLTEKQRD